MYHNSAAVESFSSYY